MMRYEGLLATYREYLPITENTPKLTLQEGNTPLIRAERLSELLDLDAGTRTTAACCLPMVFPFYPENGIENSLFRALND